MDQSQIPYIQHGERHNVTDIIADDEGFTIGTVDIKGIKHLVVRWDYPEVGFPQSSGHPAWLLLPSRMKIVISP